MFASGEMSDKILKLLGLQRMNLKSVHKKQENEGLYYEGREGRGRKTDMIYQIYQMGCNIKY